MTPPRPADALVRFQLASLTSDGEQKRVLSGYQPLCDLHAEFWTSLRMQFLTAEQVVTGESAEANVWFLMPEAYPNSLCVGRVLRIAEGTRVVGSAEVLRVLNPLLQADGAESRPA